MSISFETLNQWASMRSIAIEKHQSNDVCEQTLRSRGIGTCAGQFETERDQLQYLANNLQQKTQEKVLQIVDAIVRLDPRGGVQELDGKDLYGGTGIIKDQQLKVDSKQRNKVTLHDGDYDYSVYLAKKGWFARKLMRDDRLVPKAVEVTDKSNWANEKSLTSVDYKIKEDLLGTEYRLSDDPLRVYYFKAVEQGQFHSFTYYREDTDSSKYQEAIRHISDKEQSLLSARSIDPERARNEQVAKLIMKGVKKAVSGGLDDALEDIFGKSTEPRSYE